MTMSEPKSVRFMPRWLTMMPLASTPKYAPVPEALLRRACQAALSWYPPFLPSSVGSKVPNFSWN